MTQNCLKCLWNRRWPSDLIRRLSFSFALFKRLAESMPPRKPNPRRSVPSTLSLSLSSGGGTEDAPPARARVPAAHRHRRARPFTVSPAHPPAAEEPSLWPHHTGNSENTVAHTSLDPPCHQTPMAKAETRSSGAPLCLLPVSEST
jgi:hypothetical protein